MTDIDVIKNEHEETMAQIKYARCKEDLPNVSEKDIASYISKCVNDNYYDKKCKNKTKADGFSLLAFLITKAGTFYDEYIKEQFAEHLKYVNGVNRIYGVEDFEELYNQIIDSKKIDYILEEIEAKDYKLQELSAWEKYEAHREVMTDILASKSKNQLPKVGLTQLNKEVLKALNSNSYGINMDSYQANIISGMLIAGKEEDLIKLIIFGLVSNYVTSEEMKNKITNEIMSAFNKNELISYVTEEINAKDKRLLEIYKEEHDSTMDLITNATRLHHLPKNLGDYTLTGYLAKNSIVNKQRFNYEDFKPITDLLLKGYTFDDEEVEDVIKDISGYTSDPVNNKGMFIDLYNKLKELPRTFYIVDEINAFKEKEFEITVAGKNDVHIYIIPNYKNTQGGKFYNIYISRMEEVLDLDAIIPPYISLDEIEGYIQDNYDPTFKKAGGFIIKNKEVLGSVNVFRCNDGTIGVSPEEKEKMDSINDLDASIAEKQAQLEELNKAIEEKEETYKVVSVRLHSTIDKYREQATSISQGLMNSIDEIEKSIFGEEEEKKRN